MTKRQCQSDISRNSYKPNKSALTHDPALLVEVCFICSEEVWVTCLIVFVDVGRLAGKEFRNRNGGNGFVGVPAPLAMPPCDRLAQ